MKLHGRIFRQYLDDFAYPAAGSLAELVVDNYAYAVVIPTFDESIEAIEALMHSDGLSDVLFILVVNVPDAPVDGSEAGDAFLQAVNRTKAILQHFSLTDSCAGRYWLEDKVKSVGVLMLNFASSSRCLSRRQGVGLARKIGFDIACKLYVCGRLRNMYAFSTDADVVLPHGYLEACRKVDFTEVGLAIFPFRHCSAQSSVDLSMCQYETYLRYYVDGLHSARSPYAFYTLGSIFCISLLYYVIVRGFPKRNALEDFYLANKLASHAKVVQLTSPCLYLSSRRSIRVPVGTGPSLLSFDAEQTWLTYHPRTFDILRQMYSIILREGEKGDDMDASDEYFMANNILDLQGWFQHAEKLSITSKKAIARRHQVHVWFHGFRIRKALNAISECYFPKVPIQKALQLSLGCATPSIVDWDHWNNRLFERTTQSSSAFLGWEIEQLP